MTQPARSSRPGFTFMEMLMVIFLLALILALATGTIGAALRLHQASSAAQDDLLARGMLADQLREDVGQARSAPRQVRDLVASPTCLLLRMADGSHVVYRGTEKGLERTVLKDGQKSKPTAMVPGWKLTGFRVENGLIRLTLRKETGKAELHVQAVLGGDQR